MKLNKVKVARLTDDQAKSVQGGGSYDSTRKNFTCCWCSSGGDSFECNTVNNNEPQCNTTRPNDPSLTNPTRDLTLNP